MSQNNYDQMSLAEVKRYFLEHRDDEKAFYAYVDKLRASGQMITIDPSNPESEKQAWVEIEKRLKKKNNPN